MRVGVKRHRRDFVLAVERGAVQRLDVGEHLVDDDAAGVDVAARQAEEHERVVRVRTVGDGDSCLCHRSWKLMLTGNSQLWRADRLPRRRLRTTVVTRSMAKSMSRVGGRAAEAEADRRAGALADGADRLQHVRRRLAAGAAGGSGRHREVAERHQQRLAFDAVEADVQVVRQATRRAIR